MYEYYLYKSVEDSSHCKNSDGLGSTWYCQFKRTKYQEEIGF